MTAAIDSSSDRAFLFSVVSKSIFFIHKPQKPSLRSTKRTSVDCEYLWKKTSNSQQVWHHKETRVSFLSGQHTFFFFFPQKKKGSMS